MKAKKIYKKFDKIGSLVFATIDNDSPETRIAHFFAYDDLGLYFRTMSTKPFYHQLITNKKVSVCGMSSKPAIEHDEQGMPVFDEGYSIRLTGDVEEVPFKYIKKASEEDKRFKLGYKDYKKYPAMKFFRISKGRGEIYDYDFERVHRDYKLERKRFTLNDYEYPIQRGVFITDKCVKCQKCVKKCSFNAIYKGKKHYEIDPTRCDACGDCTLVCKYDAIKVVTD